jgi:hypothetical protein
MTDRLTLAHAFESAGIERAAAERVATEIVRAIDQSTAAKPDLDTRQGRIAKAFDAVGIARRPAEKIAILP